MWKALNGNDEKYIAKIHELNNVILDYDITVNRNISLMNGASGILLFLVYYHKLFPNSKNEKKAYDLVEQILSTIENSESNRFNISSGLAGVGWTLSHIQKNKLLNIDADELFVELHEWLLNASIKELGDSNYDLLHGSVGILFYLLTTKHSTEHICSEIIKTIADKNYFNGYDAEDSNVNLGLSHGITSLLPLLIKIKRKGFSNDLLLTLIERGTQYLLSYKTSIGTCRSYFPNSTLQKNENIGSRLAWCYGDLGISCALWQVCSEMNNVTLRNTILEILSFNSTRIEFDNTDIIDAGFCHGTAGAAHIFNRMYQATNKMEYKRSSLFWFDKTIQMAKFEDGLGGYKSYLPKEYYADMWYNDVGLLEGIAGVGLTLISCVSEIEPCWDECFLIS